MVEQGLQPQKLLEIPTLSTSDPASGVAPNANEIS